MRGIIQNRTIGSWGRFGNSIHQYLALRVLARRYDLDHQCSPWIGQQIWGFNDPLPDRDLEVIEEKMFHGVDDTIIPHMGRLRDVEIRGFFQYRLDYFAPDKEFIQGLFARPKVDRLAPAVEKLRSLAPTVIGLHIRRGDYGLPNSIFYLTPISWYLDFLEYAWTSGMALFIASDDPSVVELFARYNPVTATSLGIKFSADPVAGVAHLPKDVKDGNAVCLDVFPDWELLRHCDVIAMGNSTYGFTAAMMSMQCKRVFRSDLDTRRMEEIDLWNSFPGQFIDPAKYANVPGIWLKSNPYW